MSGGASDILPLAPPAQATEDRRDHRLVLGGLALMWLAVFNQLRLEWSVNSLYSYGFLVPLFFAYFAVRDWRSRPVPVGVPGGRWILLGLVVPVLTLPVWRWLIEANTDWRPLHWGFALTATVITLVTAWLLGGWSWAWHFTPVALLPLLGVPWPARWEEPVVQSLMRGITGQTVSLLNDLGVAALQRGNLVEVVSGVVGIDEACSGIRSIQAAFAGAVLLAMLHQLRPWRAAILLVAGFALALGGNLLRTLTLALLQASGGQELLDKWHDPAGAIEMAFALGALFFLSLWLARGQAKPLPSTSTVPVGPAFPAPPAAPSAEAAPAKRRRRPKVAPTLPFGVVPSRIALGFVAWLVCAELFTEIWYRARELPRAGGSDFTVRWPDKEKSFRDVRISARTQDALRADEAEAVAWLDATGGRWNAIYLRWRPGRPAALMGRAHRPENCFAALGRSLRANLGVLSVPAAGTEIPFDFYQFSAAQGAAANADLFVIRCIVEDRPTAGEAITPIFRLPTLRERFASAFAGRRNAGQRVVEFSLANAAGPDEARRIFAERVPQVVVRR